MKKLILVVIWGTFLTGGQQRSAAVEHIVGNSTWTIPASNSYYNDWARNTTFLVGDDLVFKFETGFYDMIQVSREEYEGCRYENPYRSFVIGPAKITFREEGTFYYLCSFGNYCSLGMNFYVYVQA
ncbi:hypothetical protein ZOSMA_14G01670 [Zostera marina]|uniref:Phytocyanin domain-containing protein n=1 Tax=Zostera marina TaxID=29655 RepID=A0A0K9PYU1_ZOSMR|nr:hypothetical protein ZOSMA_14G01670 [Zostera marina]